MADEISGRVIRTVAKLRNGLKHASPGRGRHMQSLVHDPGDGLGGDFGKVGHIIDRNGSGTRMGARRHGARSGSKGRIRREGGVHKIVS